MKNPFLLFLLFISISQVFSQNLKIKNSGREVSYETKDLDVNIVKDSILKINLQSGKNIYLTLTDNDSIYLNDRVFLFKKSLQANNIQGLSPVLISPIYEHESILFQSENQSYPNFYLYKNGVFHLLQNDIKGKELKAFYFLKQIQSLLSDCEIPFQLFKNNTSYNKSSLTKILDAYILCRGGNIEESNNRRKIKVKASFGLSGSKAISYVSTTHYIYENNYATKNILVMPGVNMRLLFDINTKTKLIFAPSIQYWTIISKSPFQSPRRQAFDQFQIKSNSFLNLNKIGVKLSYNKIEFFPTFNLNINYLQKDSIGIYLNDEFISLDEPEGKKKVLDWGLGAGISLKYKNFIFNFDYADNLSVYKPIFSGEFPYASDKIFYTNQSLIFGLGIDF